MGGTFFNALLSKVEDSATAISTSKLHPPITPLFACLLAWLPFRVTIDKRTWPPQGGPDRFTNRPFLLSLSCLVLLILCGRACNKEYARHA